MAKSESTRVEAALVDSLRLMGSVTMANVTGIRQQGLSRLRHGDVVVDWAAVTEVDSSAVSVLLEWLRAAQQSGRSVRFVHLPENLISLVRLYGALALLPPAVEI